MERIINWILKHKVWAVLVAVGIFVLPLLVVHLLFFFDAKYDWLVASWDAGDILAYVAGFEAFLGTVLLGIITVKQSKDAQKMNERLSKENNELQKISVQKLMPVVEIANLQVYDAEKIAATNFCENSVFVTETVTKNNRTNYIEVYASNAGSNVLYLKTIKFSIHNISDGAISKIEVGKIIFPSFKLRGDIIQETVCQGLDKYCALNCLILPNNYIDVEVKIYYDDIRLTQFWESHNNCDIGNFEMCMYIKNTSIPGVEFCEEIVIEKGYNFKEQIMYKSYEENETNE